MDEKGGFRLCEECGTPHMNLVDYAGCPNGHGKLTRKAGKNGREIKFTGTTTGLFRYLPKVVDDASSLPTEP